MKFWLSGIDWEREFADVRSGYPDARWEGTHEGGQHTRRLLLTMRPVPPAGELREVISDLARAAPVAVDISGRIRHIEDRECAPGHPLPVDFDRLPNLAADRGIPVSLTLPPRPHGTAGPSHPSLRLLDMELPRDHPHVYLNDGDQIACPISPQTTSWTWAPGATLKYLDHASLWLLKTLIRLDGLPWVGPDTPHDNASLVRETLVDGPCWCKSGQRYRDCHFRINVAREFDRLLPAIGRA